MTNETDRELLELAATAACIPYIKPPPDYSGCYGLQAGSTNPMRCQSWNPLTDDGDALRLAVKLGISISDDYLYPNGERVIRVGFTFGDMLYGDSEMCGDDQYATTRRAIVRAAAEIGRVMK